MSAPFFSIITPSLNRDSLVKCCASIDAQTFTGGFEHIVAFDGFPGNRAYAHGKNRKLFSFRQTRQWGNYQRHSAWKYATGKMVLHIDDDNILAHPDALKDIAERIELAGNPAWAIFPIMRHGRWFFNDPPGMCMTDTMNLVIRREFAQWPNIAAREADGVLTDKLKADHPYAAFPDCPPIGVMEHSSNGI